MSSTLRRSRSTKQADAVPAEDDAVGAQQRSARPTNWRWGAPRLITREQLRAYLQVAEAELSKRLARGHVPGPLWGCDPALPDARWDRHAVDRAVDRASAIPSHIEAAAEEMDNAFGPRASTPR